MDAHGPPPDRDRHAPREPRRQRALKPRRNLEQRRPFRGTRPCGSGRGGHGDRKENRPVQTRNLNRGNLPRTHPSPDVRRGRLPDDGRHPRADRAFESRRLRERDRWRRED